jgi:6-pyruvoyltetrahydropterin/6-carboxytetrahydropterin synthase
MRDMVLDFGVFKKEVRAFADELDHTFLVEEGSLRPATIDALEKEGFNLHVLPFRTTAENLAKYASQRLTDAGLPVCRVYMYETPLNCASYIPQDLL